LLPGLLHIVYLERDLNEGGAPCVMFVVPVLPVALVVMRQA
jgi:hypothetical protein